MNPLTTCLGKIKMYWLSGQ